VFATPTDIAPMGYDILKWGGTGTSASIVVEVRGFSERLRWELIVDVGGRRVLDMENFPELRVEDICSMESLATLLEGVDAMTVCGGVPGSGRVGLKE
jgi:hypothetical protein